MGRFTKLFLTLVFGFQAFCAIIFVAEFVTEVFGLRAWAIPWHWREILQFSASVALLLGAITSIIFLRRMFARESQVESQLAAASGEFFKVMDHRFDDWSLSRSEREVALYALRGLSNTEIAELRSKSEATIKTQLNSVFRKAHVASRAELMSEFVELLIEDPLVPN